MSAEFEAFFSELTEELQLALAPFRGVQASDTDPAKFVDAVAPPAAKALELNEEAEPYVAEWVAGLWKGKGRPPIAKVMGATRKLLTKIGMNKMDKKSFSGYWNFFAKLKIHDAMLNDVARTNAYRDAILGNAESIAGKIVMDLGAGTGLLGFFALQAGAKHVYAIEASSMAEVVRDMAEANGFTDRMTIVNQVLQDVSYETIAANSCDVLISETLSHLIFNEKGCEGLFVARDRFLKKGGLIMPDTATLYLAPWCDENMHTKHYTMPDIWKNTNFHGLNLTVLQSRFEKERLRTSITDFADPKVLVAPPCSKTWDFKTMTLEELDCIPVACEWTPSRTTLIHGVIGWFNVTLGADKHVVNLNTGPLDEWTHWNQGRVTVREPLAVNRGQKLVGEFNMRNNEFMSYDVTLKLSLPGTDVTRENPNCSLIDTNTEFSKVIKVYDRIVGVPYDCPQNWVPEYVKPGYVRPGAFQPPPRVGEAGSVPNGTTNDLAQDQIMKFGNEYFVPAQGKQLESITEAMSRLVVITNFNGRQFSCPDGVSRKGVVEILPGPDGTAQHTYYWQPRDTPMVA
jgi:histone-arginine methyltransferase CARM1